MGVTASCRVMRDLVSIGSTTAVLATASIPVAADAARDAAVASGSDVADGVVAGCTGGDARVTAPGGAGGGSAAEAGVAAKAATAVGPRIARRRRSTSRGDARRRRRPLRSDRAASASQPSVAVMVVVMMVEDEAWKKRRGMGRETPGKRSERCGLSAVRRSVRR